MRGLLNVTIAKRMGCLALLCVLGGIFLSCHMPTPLVHSTDGWVFLSSYKEVERLLPSSLTNQFVYDFRVSASRDYLFVNTESNLIVIDSRECKVLSSPAILSFTSTNGEYLIWYNDLKEGVTFYDGTTIALPADERFGVSLDGEYFYISSLQKGMRLYRSRNPKVVILSIENVMPYRMINVASNLCICVRGTSSPLHKGPWMCYFVNIEGSDARSCRVLTLPEAVIDVSPNGRYFLIDDGSDLLPCWYVYDSQKDVKKFAGFRQDRGFWITEKLAESLRGGRRGEGAKGSDFK